jgi:hypothetical protein
MTTHKAIAKLDEKSAECKSKKCSGALCSNPEFLLKLQTAAILKRYTDLLGRLNMKSGTELDVLALYRREALAQTGEYTRYGRHQYECPAHKYIETIHGGSCVGWP